MNSLMEANVVPNIILQYDYSTHFTFLPEFVQFKLQKYTSLGTYSIPYNWIVDTMIECESTTINQLKQVFTDHQIVDLPRYKYHRDGYTNFSPKVLEQIIRHYESPDMDRRTIQDWVNTAKLIANNPDYLDTSDDYYYSPGSVKSVYFLKGFVRCFSFE